jgi:DNA (cytosine-5)-methyltransferase 1
MKNRIKALSLFSNVGIYEAYFKQIGIDVLVANEIEKKRCDFYSHVYPYVDVVCGDITENSIKEILVAKSINYGIDLVMSTPPCQGMSTAGKMEENDLRNSLICHSVAVIKKIKPKYVFFENVPEQLSTKILFNGQRVLIPDYLHMEFDNEYVFNDNFLINAADYGVPQLRERAIILLVRKELNKKWTFPKPNKTRITLREAIGKLPQLDPEISDMSLAETLKVFPNYLDKKESGLKISKWFYPPSHPYRQIYSMIHTPSGKSAFSNKDEFKPKKKDGTIVKGFANTYKRQDWDKPAYTITMYNRTIGSQNNVHPGRLIGKNKNGDELYSDPRVLTIYELMIVSSLPLDWNIPEWATDHFIRAVIGEGVPPLLTKEIMKELIIIHNEK